MEKKYIFGAGTYGEKAYETLGADNVLGFLDNDTSKWGTFFHGKEVIGLEEYLSRKEDVHIVIASIYSNAMKGQLDRAGIHNYSFFYNTMGRIYETDELIFNPYHTVADVSTEKEWKESKKLEYSRRAVFEEVERLYGINNLFTHVEVETINRCNGNCSFCPVNQKIDPREKKVMTEELFKNIVDQLSEIEYSGRFTTFSNNEPLLDDRIIEFNKYAREKLPKARIHIYTNGTLFTLEKFISLVEYLDELIIDNYQQELQLIKPCREIAAYCEENPELKKKVTIVLRKPHEILTTRGGTAPNRSDKENYAKDRCVLPFKQIIIRPDGKVSLCCNDAIGQYTLGDVRKEKLTDIWYGPRFSMVRKCLYQGRENWGNCQYCDAFSLG